MIEKTVCYIKTLSDEEIEEQLEDFLLWAREYEQALKKELKERHMNAAFTTTNSKSQTNIFDGIHDLLIVKKDTSADESIDYEIATMICKKVSSFDKEKTIERLRELKEKSRGNITSNELRILNFEIRECEQHLHNISVEEIILQENLCSACGNKLDRGSAFCGKCGYPVS